MSFSRSLGYILRSSIAVLCLFIIPAFYKSSYFRIRNCILPSIDSRFLTSARWYFFTFYCYCVASFPACLAGFFRNIFPSFFPVYRWQLFLHTRFPQWKDAGKAFLGCFRRTQRFRNFLHLHSLKDYSRQWARYLFLLRIVGQQTFFIFVKVFI